MSSSGNRGNQRNAPWQSINPSPYKFKKLTLPSTESAMRPAYYEDKSVRVNASMHKQSSGLDLTVYVCQFSLNRCGFDLSTRTFATRDKASPIVGESSVGVDQFPEHAVIEDSRYLEGMWNTRCRSSKQTTVNCQLQWAE